MNSADWGNKVAKHSRVFKPAGPGPFPVALILHGCGGKTPFLEDYARAAVAAGWAAVVVDSLKPRGMSSLDAKLFVCTGVALRGLTRAADVFAMLAWLETQGWADPERVFLAGWSHGGWTIMDSYAIGENAARATKLADADPVRLRQRVRGALLVYPYAGYPSLTSRRGWGEGRRRSGRCWPARTPWSAGSCPARRWTAWRATACAWIACCSTTPPTPSTTTRPTIPGPAIGPTSFRRCRPISPGR